MAMKDFGSAMKRLGLFQGPTGIVLHYAIKRSNALASTWETLAATCTRRRLLPSEAGHMCAQHTLERPLRDKIHTIYIQIRPSNSMRGLQHLVQRGASNATGSPCSDLLHHTTVLL